ncbi:MAG TPA: type II toxin-antitoxin system death-on-curing family toxin [Acidimicrobiales bacterium]|nr:type II toxin-antitoxin system death-on-curing family toxin [Acidimicrobiales bacterium]
MTRFLQVDDVLALAEAVTGGSPGVRDLGLIASAGARPQASFGGVDAYPSLHLKAAALLESLAGNRALVDGNKRTALASVLFFYDLNGLRVTLTHDEAVDLVIGIVVHRIDIEKAADILRSRTAPR